MHSVKGKKWNRRLSFLLVLVLLFGDSSLQHVMAAETGTAETQITEHRVETEADSNTHITLPTTSRVYI